MLNAVGIGTVLLKTRVGRQSRIIQTENVYHVPNIRKNILSIGQMESKGNSIHFSKGEAIIKNVRDEIIAIANRQNGLYLLNGEIIISKIKNTEIDKIEMQPILINKNKIWHHRFCHTNDVTLQQMMKNNMVVGMEDLQSSSNSTSNKLCENCCIGKSTKTPCTRLNNKQSSRILELIHSDLCGPMPVQSRGHARYFLTLIDDFSRKLTVFILKEKSEAEKYIKQYIAMVENHTEKQVKRFRTDNGLEFCCKALSDYFNQKGIKHERSNRETPQMIALQNVLTERYLILL